jgi:hypothetical protein
VFALLLLEDGPAAAGAVVDVVVITVGLSVVLHGATAAWGAGAYAAWHRAAARTDPGLREGPAVVPPAAGPQAGTPEPRTTPPG